MSKMEQFKQLFNENNCNNVLNQIIVIQYLGSGNVLIKCVKYGHISKNSIYHILGGQRCGHKICRKESTKKTCQEKYGSDTPLQCIQIMNKTKATMQKRYGGQHGFQCKVVQQKIRNNFFIKNGILLTKHMNNLFFNKHGVNTPYKLKTFSKKARITKLDRYGSETYNNQKAIRCAKFIKYGSETYNNQSKARETCIKRFGKSQVQLMCDGWKFNNTKIQLKTQQILQKNNINYQKNFRVYYYDKDNTKKFKVYDFYLIDKNILIQCDGQYWHMQQLNMANDHFKNNLAKCNGFKLKRFWGKQILNCDFENKLLEYYEKN